MSTHHSVLVIGGGTAGLSVAARLRNAGVASVAIVEPSDKHYYQPLWTLVGAGVFPREVTERPEADYIPAGATWIKDAAVAFSPETNTVELASGAKVTYDQLVVAPGIQLDWNKIDGLAGNVGKNGIVSNYGYDTVNSTWEALRSFKGGNAIFTMPPVPIKCAGAPQKILYLADDALRRQGVREKSNLIYMAAGAGIFGVAKYAAALRPIVTRKGIDARYRQNLVAVRPTAKEAVFRHLDTGEETVLKYEMLHVVPPQSSPDFIKKSPLADAGGWVAVDKYSLQHVKYPNVFSLGDASSLPTSRTGAAIRKQAPVLVENLLAFRAGDALKARYDGYASCPLVTGYGKLILAEFDYDGNPAESFPFDQAQERFSMYVLKAYGLPEMYWNGMLRGRA
jgi:sulfide:quinone oxidoreductase